MSDDPVRSFAAKVLRAHRRRLDGMDGGELQEVARASGLLDWVTMQAPCGDECECVEYGDEFPNECLRLTDAARSLLEEYPE